MANKVTEKVRLSFEDAFKDDPSPMVVVYNPRILSFALSSQLMRFGLSSNSDKKPTIFGKLKGNRTGIIQVIHTYGLGVEIVPPTKHLD